MKGKFNTYLLVAMFSILLLSTSVTASKAEIIEQFNTYDKVSVDLQPFFKPITIILVHADETHERLDDKFKHEAKVAHGFTAIGVRDLSEALGKDIHWDEENRIVELKADQRKILLPIDRQVIAIDDELKDLDVAATIHPDLGATFLPMRVLAETLGYEITWDQKTFTATLYEPGAEVIPIEIPEEEKPELDSGLVEKDKTPAGIPNVYRKGGHRDVEVDWMIDPALKIRMIADPGVEFGIEPKDISNTKVGFDISNSPLKIAEAKWGNPDEFKQMAFESRRVHVVEPGQIDARMRFFIAYEDYTSDDGVPMTVFAAPSDMIKDYHSIGIVTDDGKYYSRLNNAGFGAKKEYWDLPGKTVTGLLYLSADKDNQIPRGELLLIPTGPLKLPSAIPEEYNYKSLTFKNVYDREQDQELYQALKGEE